MKNNIKPNLAINDLRIYEALLKPCPVCGGTDIGLYGSLEDKDGVYDVFCDEKYKTGGDCTYVAGYATPELAVKAWNNREDVYNM